MTASHNIKDICLELWTVSFTTNCIRIIPECEKRMYCLYDLHVLTVISFVWEFGCQYTNNYRRYKETLEWSVRYFKGFFLSLFTYLSYIWSSQFSTSHVPISHTCNDTRCDISKIWCAKKCNLIPTAAHALSISSMTSFQNLTSMIPTLTNISWMNAKII